MARRIDRPTALSPQIPQVDLPIHFLALRHLQLRRSTLDALTKSQKPAAHQPEARCIKHAVVDSNI